MLASTTLFWAMGTLLVAVRVAMLFIATPLFGNIPVPTSARVILILGLALPMARNVSLSPTDMEPLRLAILVAHEALIGSAIAAGLFFGFAAMHLGGRLLDLQIGFGVASLVDIASKNNTPLLGSLLSMMAALVFFALDGHVALLRILAISVEKLPPGTDFSGLDFGALIAQFGTCFAFGFVIVAPIVLCLLLVDFGMAFMSRTMPQMNVFVMSLSLKVLVGLLLLATIVPLLSSNLRRIFETMFAGWTRLVS